MLDEVMKGMSLRETQVATIAIMNSDVNCYVFGL